jgi:succinate dehydrogenase / fumarate reductase, cytochrome b subunit
MRRVTTLYSYSVGKKFWMAVSGLILFGFVVGHMLGNLKAFQPHDGSGSHPLDVYGQFLREFGYPLFPEYGVLWLARIALLAAVLVHIAAAVQLWRSSRQARGRGYHRETSQVFSYASRTMRWGGVIIAAFVVYHLLHFTTGHAHPDFEYGRVYDNLVIGFQNPLVVGVYLVAVGALCLHLYHGLWSIFSTLGVQNRRIDRIRRPLAAVFSVGLFVGYAVVPLAVVVGILTPG